jgi:hypothetical protein
MDTSYNLCKQEYEKLCKEFGKSEINIVIGDIHSYYKDVWKENLQIEFISMLSEPAPDWQRDC